MNKSEPPNKQSKSEKAPDQQFSKYVSVPAHEGVRVEKVITIERPVSQVYSFWEDLHNLPRFMRHLDSVTVRDGLHSHWAANIAGKVVEWDAEIIEKRQNEMISWRSTPRADVDNAGSVWFTPVPGNQATMVRLALKYNTPDGKTDLMTQLFAPSADAQIEEDLGRLKNLLETGQLPKTQSAQTLPLRAVEKSRSAVQEVNRFLRENPWAFLSCAAGLGLLIGLLIGIQAKRAHRFEEG